MADEGGPSTGANEGATGASAIATQPYPHTSAQYASEALAFLPQPSVSNVTPSIPTTISRPLASGLSASTEELLRRIGANAANPASYQAARESVLKSMVRTESVSLPESTPTKQGRGRGRGGTPRGSATMTGGAVQTATMPTPDSVRGTGRGRGRARARGRGGRGGRGGKRKRSDSDADELSLSEDDFDDDLEMADDVKPIKVQADEDESTAFPATTKSGRAVHKPTQFIPTTISPATNTARKKRTYHRKAADPLAALCKMCDRGHSPDNNQVVFCDGCSNAYHQFCHDPPIDRMTVLIPEKEWFCASCARKRETKIAGTALEGLVSGEALSLNERKTYFATLTHAKLVNLLLQATALHPTLPLFPSSALPSKQTSKTSITARPTPPKANGINGATTHAVSNPTSASHANPQSANEDLDDLITGEEPDYIEDDDELPPNYPQQGNGLAKALLRPEVEDEQWLIDDNFAVFSHQTNDLDPGAARAREMATMAMQIDSTVGGAELY